MDVDQLRAAHATVAATLRWADPEQWDAPTPCEDWSVRQLVDHLVSGQERFVQRLTAADITDRLDRTSAAPAELIDAYEGAAARLATTFKQPGILQRVATFPIGPIPGAVALRLAATETLTHGWDLAQGLGTTVDFDPDTIAEAYAFSADAVPRIPADRNPFGSPQPVSDDAPALDRLAALLGRQVAWAGSFDG